MSFENDKAFKNRNKCKSENGTEIERDYEILNRKSSNVESYNDFAEKFNLPRFDNGLKTLKSSANKKFAQKLRNEEIENGTRKDSSFTDIQNMKKESWMANHLNEQYQKQKSNGTNGKNGSNGKFSKYNNYKFNFDFDNICEDDNKNPGGPYKLVTKIGEDNHVTKGGEDDESDIIGDLYSGKMDHYANTFQNDEYSRKNGNERKESNDDDWIDVLIKKNDVNGIVYHDKRRNRIVAQVDLNGKSLFEKYQSKKALWRLTEPYDNAIDGEKLVKEFLKVREDNDRKQAGWTGYKIRNGRLNKEIKIKDDRIMALEVYREQVEARMRVLENENRRFKQQQQFGMTSRDAGDDYQKLWNQQMEKLIDLVNVRTTELNEKIVQVAKLKKKLSDNGIDVVEERRNGK